MNLNDKITAALAVIERAAAASELPANMQKVMQHTKPQYETWVIHEAMDWFDGSLNISLRNPSVWTPELYARFIPFMAAIGRTYPTTIPQRAYRTCLVGYNRKVVVGQESTLAIGPRSILSFTGKLSKAKQFSNTYQHRQFDQARMVVSVPVSAANYLTTFAAFDGFLNDVKANIDKLSELYGLYDSQKEHMLYRIKGIQKFKPHYEYEEVVLSFRSAVTKVYVESTVAPGKPVS